MRAAPMKVGLYYLIYHIINWTCGRLYKLNGTRKNIYCLLFIFYKCECHAARSRGAVKSSENGYNCTIVTQSTDLDLYANDHDKN